MGGVMMALARLVLDYLKILIWPIIVVLVLTLYGRDVITLIARIKKVSMAGIADIELSTGADPQRDAPVQTSTPPRMWLNLKTLSASQRECLQGAEHVLRAKGFAHNLQHNGQMSVSGEVDEYSGIIWCVSDLGLAFFVVAGPDAAIAREKSNELLFALESILTFTGSR